MFELEFIELLNKLKNTSNKYDFNNIFTSIQNLIKQNKKEYENFKQKNQFDKELILFLEKIENKINTKNQIEQTTQIKINQNKKTQENKNLNYQTINSTFKNWLFYYQKNNNQIDNNCEEIIYNLINDYLPNNTKIITKILNIKLDDKRFEIFSNMLNDFLRQYFAKQIKNYLNSQNYLELGFFKKRQKDKQIFLILKDICQFNFENLNIEETIK